MSTSRDTRVVEMRFDNAQFERNASTTMRTLDKLKGSLNLEGSAKGFDSISKAASNVDLSPMTTGLEAVQLGFSKLQVVSNTVITDLTRKIGRFGEKLWNDFAVKPVKTGFEEYELKMNSVQTIMAGTGEDIKVVNQYLDELNTYSDKTIYSFSDMTSNIGKFTNSGVKLRDSVDAMMGICNAAALAGANSNEASRAMYNLAQSISMGYVQYIDWKSIENANMATMGFKEQLLETALAYETITKSGDEYVTSAGKVYNLQSMFKDGMKDAWLTSDVLIDTLRKYSDENLEIGKSAFAAAQDVKTFSMMMETLNEAVQSGWGTTFQLIFGDLIEAKDLWTKLTNFFGGILDFFSNARNDFLAKILGNPFSDLSKRLGLVVTSTEQASEAMAELGNIVDDVINGKLGNGKARWDKLTEAGYDWAHVQNLVNEKLGSSVRHATDYVEGQNEMQKSIGRTIEDVCALNETQLKYLGFTDDEVEALKALKTQAEIAGVPIKEMYENLDKFSGRSLLLEGFENIGTTLVTVFNVMRKSFSEVIPQLDPNVFYRLIVAFNNMSKSFILTEDQISNLSTIFKGIASAIDIVTTITGGGLKLAFKVVTKVLKSFNLTVLDLLAGIASVVTNIDQWIFNNQIVENTITAISDAIVYCIETVRTWIAEFKKTAIFTNIVTGLKSAVKGIKDVGLFIVEGLLNGLETGVTLLPQKIAEIAQSLIDKAREVLGIHSPSLEFFKIGEFTFLGLLEGFKNIANKVLTGISSFIVAIIDVGTNAILNNVPMVCGAVKNAISKIKDAAKKEFTIQFSFKDLFGKVVDKLREFGAKAMEVLGKIDFRRVLAVGVTAGIFDFVRRMEGVVESVTGSFDKIAGAFSGFSDSIQNVINSAAAPIAEAIGAFANNLNSIAFENRTEGIKNLAISVGLIVAAIILLAEYLAKGEGDIKSAIGIIAGIAVTLAVIGVLMGRLGKQSVTMHNGAIQMNNMIPSLIVIAGAVAIMAGITVALGKMKPDELTTGLSALITCVSLLAILMYVMFHTVGQVSPMKLKAVGTMLLEMAGCFAIMAIVLKLCGNLEYDQITKGVACMTAFVGLMAFMILITKLSSNRALTKNLSLTLLSMAASFLIMTAVLKLAGNLNKDEAHKGAVCIAYFVALMVGMVAMTKLVTAKDLTGLGTTLIGMSVCMLIMTAVMWSLALLPGPEMLKGGAAILAFAVIIGIMIAFTRAAGPQIGKMALTLIAMATAVAILAGVAILLGLINPDDLKQGIIAVGILSAFMDGMLLASSKARTGYKNIYAMVAAIAVMSACVIFLSRVRADKLVPATVCLGALMGVFSLMMFCGKFATGGMGSIIAMTVAVGIMAGAVWLIAQLDTEKALASVGALSILLITFTAALVILGAASKVTAAAIHGIFLVALCAAMCIGLMYLLQLLPTESVLPKVLELSGLMLLLTGVFALLGLAAPLMGAAVAGIAGFGLCIAEIIGMLEILGALKQIEGFEWLMDEGIDLLTKMAEGLGYAFGSFIASIGTAITDALPGMADKLKEFADKLVPATEQLAAIDSSCVDGVKKLVELVGVLGASSLLDAVTSWLTGKSAMDAFLENLEPFGKAMVSFSNTVKGNIDIPSITAAAIAGRSIAEMFKAVAKEGGLLDKIFGTRDVDGFVNQVTSFGEAIVGFSNAVKESPIDLAKVKDAAQAGEAIAKMSKEINAQGGYLQDFLGNKDLGTFSYQLGRFGDAIVNFSDTVTKNPINKDKVNDAVEVGTAIIKMTHDIESQGGILQSWLGEKDLGTFSAQLNAFGQAIKTFNWWISDGVDINNCQAAADVGKMFVSLAEAIPSNGGIWQKLTGDKNLSDLGLTISNFGKNLAEMQNAFGQNGINPELFRKAKVAGGYMVDTLIYLNEGMNKLKDMSRGGNLTEKVSNDLLGTVADLGSDVVDSVAGLITGEDLNVKEMTNQMTSFVDMLTSVSNKVSTMALNIEAMNRAKKAAEIVAGMTTYFPDMNNLNVLKKDFGDKLTKLAEGIVGFTDKMTECNVDKFKTSIESISEIAKLSAFVNSDEFGGFGKLSVALTSFSSKAVTGFIKVFKDAGKDVKNAVTDMTSDASQKLEYEGKTTLVKAVETVLNKLVNEIKTKEQAFVDCGMVLNNKFAEGIRTYSGTATGSIIALMTTAENIIRGYYDKFKVTGEYVGDGLVEGLNNRKQAVQNAAAALGDAALDGLNNGGSTKSAGTTLGEGFAEGLDEVSSKLYQSGQDIGDGAISAISDSISVISKMLDSDMDTQPTIRPVLDLGDMSHGIKSMNDMLALDPRVGLLSNVGSVSSLMNRRQNGNSDIVSAINGLRKEYSNSSNGMSIDLTVNCSGDSNSDQIANEIAYSLKKALRRGVL